MTRRNKEDPDHGKDVIDLNEAACRLDLHPKTYVALMEEGLLPGTKSETKGRRTVVIPRSAYEIYCKLGRMPRYEEVAA